MTFESKRAYEVWLELIADEALCEATLGGEQRKLAEGRGLDAETCAILDHFASLPGTRWNIENLRYRSAAEIAAVVEIHLPRTIRMLTHGLAEWLQDITYEYAAHHRWQSLGQHRLAECERFGRYVRERIMKRRRTEPHLDVVLDFELAVVDLERQTAGVDPKDWPPPTELPQLDEALLDLAVRWAPAVKLIVLPVDISAWIATGEVFRDAAKEGSITMLASIPSLTEGPRFTKLGDGARLILEACKKATVADVCGHMSDEYSLEADDVLPIIRRWLEQRVLSSC